MMIYPISEHTIRPHVGKMAYAVMHDGRRYVGRISGVARGQLVLNDIQGNGMQGYGNRPPVANTYKNRKNAKQTKRSSSGNKSKKTGGLSMYEQAMNFTDYPEYMAPHNNEPGFPYAGNEALQQRLGYPGPTVGARTVLDLESIAALSLIL